VTPALLTNVLAYGHRQDETSQGLTTTAATYGALSVGVTVPSGKTYNVVVMAMVDLRTSVLTSGNWLYAFIYEDSTVRATQYMYTDLVNRANTTSVVWAGQITADKTFTVKVRKHWNWNTDIAYYGNMVVLYWEAPP